MPKINDKDNMVYNMFKDIENRYLQWMNYYSLFNGALLVAYCTILVSTGQVIEMGGGISTKDGLTGNARLFQLECTYWNILALIALLGCVASYCWYLSAIGHYHWIERWRKTIKENKNYPELNFRDVEICSICNKAKHYHSTYIVTKHFIGAVLFAWLCVFIYSVFNDLCIYIILISSAILTVFFWFLERYIHIWMGSDLSPFNQNPKIFTDKLCVFVLLLKENIKWIIIIIALVLLSGYSAKFMC